MKSLSRWYCLFGIFFLCLCLLNLYDIFIIQNQPSYYSDGRYYFLLSQEFPPKYGNGYTFILILSFCNLLIGYNNTLFLFIIIYLIFSLWLIKSLKLRLINFLLLFHPFIAFVFVRGLKEMILFFLLGFFLLALKKINLIKSSFLSGIYFQPMAFLKPLGGFLLPLVLIVNRLVSKWSVNFMLRAGVFLMILLPILRNFLTSIIPRLENQIGVLSDSGFTVNYTSNPLLPIIRFIFGPGPFKAFKSYYYDIYEFSSVMTSTTLFLGSIITLIYFALVFINWNKYSILDNPTNRIIILLSIIHSAMYILIQDGSVDTRQRAVLFFLISLLAIKKRNYQKSFL